MATRDNDARAWLALRMVRGIGPVVYQALLRAFGTPAAVLAASVPTLTSTGLRPELARAIRRFDGWARVDRQVECLTLSGAHLVTWTDARYPANLRTIHDPPPFVFVHGALQAGDQIAVAVVGSRRVSAYGLRLTRELTRGLVRHGVTVVSGLARGTDAEAHWSAVHAGGRTVAVLGSGIDVVYPSEHHALFRAIADHGAVISELFMGAQPDAENFPNRNRIISGLALGTVVIEATEKSGSLITATLAAEQGREVFAVPGAVGDGTRGTHRLIRDGAKLTERVEDIVEEIAPQLLHRLPRSAPATLDGDEAVVFGAMSPDAMHVDGLITRTGLPPSRVLQTLLALELKGVVQQLPGKYFITAPVDERRIRTPE